MIVKDAQRKLFELEFRVLEYASSMISSEKYQGNELLEEYAKLVESYDKLLSFTRKMTVINDSQASTVLQREIEIQRLLDNAKQGFLTFGRDFLVNQESSAACLKIFGKKIGGQSILRLLETEDIHINDGLEKVLQAIFDSDDADQQKEYLQKIPKIFGLHGRQIEMDLKVIPSSADQEILIMMILSDVTDKIKAQEEIVFLSYHDKLTGLNNRAFVDSWLDEFHPSEHFPLSVIMIDVNGLKLTNDVFGHQEGDELLVALSEVLRKSCRKLDIVVRWGGDEFLILLPRTDHEACAAVCERIQDGCKDVNSLPIELSISIGSAVQQSPLNSIQDLFGIAENRMYNNKLLQGRTVRRNLILSMEKVMHTRFFTSRGHITRCVQTAASFLDIVKPHMGGIHKENFMLFARLHDIGKVSIPREILGKRQPLSLEEWEIMKSHSEIGFRMAQSIEEAVIGKSILSLRERWDGKGYPRGLEGSKIPLMARVFAIIEAFDVMTHDRPYRDALTEVEAMDELKKCAGSQFDPELTDLFIGYLEKDTSKG